MYTRFRALVDDEGNKGVHAHGNIRSPLSDILEVADVVAHLNFLAEETARELLEYDSPYNGTSAVLAMDEWVQQVMLPAMDTDAE